MLGNGCQERLSLISARRNKGGRFRRKNFRRIPWRNRGHGYGRRPRGQPTVLPFHGRTVA